MVNSGRVRKQKSFGQAGTIAYIQVQSFPAIQRALKMLALSDLYGESNRLHAADIFNECQTHKNSEQRFAADITQSELQELQSLQRTLAVLKARHTSAIRMAWDHLRSTHSVPMDRQLQKSPQQDKSSTVDKRLENYLKLQRADVPRGGNSVERSAALLEACIHEALREAGGDEGKFARRMRQLTGAPKLREEHQAPFAPDVVSHLLALNTSTLINDVIFSPNGLVLRLTLLEPLKALHLGMHIEAASLPLNWGTCVRCHDQFQKKRSDSVACAKCRESLKTESYRTRKKHGTKGGEN